MKNNGIRTMAMAILMMAAGFFTVGEALARDGIFRNTVGIRNSISNPDETTADAAAPDPQTALFRNLAETEVGALASGLPVAVDAGALGDEFCSKDWGAPINALAAETFGMTEEAVVDALHRGAVLLELAETRAQEWEFMFNMVDRINALIDEAVAAGVITEAQAAMLRRAAPALAAYVSENGGGPYWGSGLLAGKFWGLWRYDVTDYLAIPLEDLAAELRSGVTVGELTESLGKDVDGLVSILTRDFNAVLDRLVADGVIPPERADFLRIVADKIVLRLIYATPPCWNQ